MSNTSKIATLEQVKDNETFFEIPPYQRLYEWENRQIETLLDDMKKACDEGKEQYFIGNITTSKKGDRFALIDGQQRLTTLWFIGFYFAKKCDEWKNFIAQGENLRISMPIRDNEETALKELARNIKDKRNLADSLPSNIHTKIKAAFECIEMWFNNAEKIQASEIENFAKFIYEKVCFIFVELAQNTDLNRFFVRMNNRGKQLESHEILKARILHKISDEREKYAEIWNLCNDMNRYIFQSKDSEICEVESIIDFPTFLLHCYKLYTKQDIQIDKNKLLEIIELKDSEAKDFIESMLRYHVLFDSFVIKFAAKKGSELGEKESSYKIKRLGTDDNLVDLEMIQNYLRTARRGRNQNYEHWLTDFLRFLDSENDFDALKAFADVTNFYNKIKDEKSEAKLVEILEKIDTKQIFEVNLKDGESSQITADYLSKGTATPHYWFYRLEYYLWKWGKYQPEKLGDFCTKLDDYGFDSKAKNCVLNHFHFRILGSIEHFSARQREENRENEWNLDAGLDVFGNLALISRNFNSSLSNQLEQFKKDEVIRQLKRGRLESLKYFIMCANLDGDEWSEENAKNHQNQMIAILIESLKDS